MRTKIVVTIIIVSMAFVGAVHARNRNGVGLGVSLGAAFPEGQVDKDKFDVSNWDAGFNWGFYVNIPILSTFHLTPSAELYKMGDQNTTDISLAFKFIIDVWKLDLFVGLVPGLTAVNDIIAPNVGGLGGLSFNLFSNVDMFFQIKYKILFNGDHNSRVLHANAGFLFNF